MTTNGHVWTGNNLSVLMFEEDSNGDPIGLGDPSSYDPDTDTPLLDYCFFEDAKVDKELQAQRRPVTGRPHLKITTRQYGYVMTVGHLYFEDQKAEFSDTNIFERTKRFTLIMFYCDEQDFFARLDEPREESHVLRHAIAKSSSLSSKKGNSLAQGNAIFWGEEFE